MTTKIHRVLAAVGDSTTVAEIEQDTGIDQDFIRNALLTLRSRKQVVRLNEGRPNCEAGIFAITAAGRLVLRGADPVNPVPSVPMVHQAIAKRPFLATMWAGA